VEIQYFERLAAKLLNFALNQPIPAAVAYD